MATLTEQLAANPVLYGGVSNDPYNDAAIDETWKYVLGARTGLGFLRGLIRPKSSLNTEELIRNFFDKNNPLLENAPEDYSGERNIDDVLNYLGSQNKNDVQIKSPIEDITFNRSNLAHLLYDNEPQRLQYLNRLRRTLEDPYYIIKETRDDQLYNGYYKPFWDNEKVDGYFGIIKNATDGNFYSTGMPIRASRLKNKINNGQVIYNNLSDQTAPISKDMSVNNIINYIKKKFNP